MWPGAMVRRTLDRLALISLDFTGFERANAGAASVVTADT